MYREPPFKDALNTGQPHYKECGLPQNSYPHSVKEYNLFSTTVGPMVSFIRRFHCTHSDQSYSRHSPKWLGKVADIWTIIIPTQGILPNDLERSLIFELTRAIQESFNVIINPNTTANNTGFEGPLFQQDKERDIKERDIISGIPARMRRQISLGPAFTNDRILMALIHENACNSMLRTSARAIIEE